MPAWVEPAAPIAPWRAAARSTPPESGVITLPDVTFEPVGPDWFVISSETGGWAILSDQERANYTALTRQTLSAPAGCLVTSLWQRGLIAVDGRTALTGADWIAAVEETREHYGLVVVLNAGCNLACTYCYLGHGAPSRSNDIDRPLAEAAIRGALARPEPVVIIDFGEFAAAQSLFIELAVYAEKQAKLAGKRLRIAVQTNATTLNDQIIDFLADRDAILGVSVDGPTEIHNQARPFRGGRGSHGSVDSALARCRARGLAYHLIVTVGAHNVRYTDDVLNEIARLNPKTFLCKPILAHGEARTGWALIGATETQIAGFLGRSIERAASSDLSMLDQSATKFLARLLGDRSGWRESCTSRSCSSGRNLHVLSARGELHACPRFVEPGHGQPVKPQTVDLLLAEGRPLLDEGLREAPASCASCPWLRSCGGGCTLSGQANDLGLVPLPDEHCPSYMAQHAAIVKHLIPALLTGQVPLDGPLAGARIRVQDPESAYTT